ncbi:anion permease [Candidatus Bathyarchaeota archaeon]|nr:anion permease [Candidatus Bathyarchaeota archaeon]
MSWLTFYHVFLGKSRVKRKVFQIHTLARARYKEKKKIPLVGLEIIPFIIVSCYIAWGIGANDETMMIAASGSTISMNRLALIGAVTTCIGAIFFGQIVEETIGKGILTNPATTRAGLTIVAAIASWLTIVSYFGWPVSTSHSTLGAIIGYGIYTGGPQMINWRSLNPIIVSWIASPLLGFLLSYLIVKPLAKNGDNAGSVTSKRWLYALIFAAILQEFWQGANNVSSATAFLSATSEQPLITRTLGGVFIAVGLLMIGRRVIIAAGRRITRLPLKAAFGTQVIIVLINAVGTLYGLPLSGTHLSVGCLIGAGSASKTKIDYRMCRNVLLYWLITIPGAAFFSIAITYISGLIFT